MIKNYKLVFILILIAHSFQTQILTFLKKRQLLQDIDFSIDIQPLTDRILVKIYRLSILGDDKLKLFSNVPKGFRLSVHNTKQIYEYPFIFLNQDETAQVSIFKQDIESYFKTQCPNSICQVVLQSTIFIGLSFYVSFLSNSILETSIAYDNQSNYPLICSTCDIPEQDKVSSTISDVQCLNSRQEYCSPLKINVLSDDQISITQIIEDPLKFSTLVPFLVYIDYQSSQKFLKKNNFKYYIKDYSFDKSVYGQITYTFTGNRAGKGKLTIISYVLNGDVNKDKIRVISKYSYLTNTVDFEVLQDETQLVQQGNTAEQDKNSSEQSEKYVGEDKSSDQSLKLLVIILSTTFSALILFFIYVLCQIQKKVKRIQPYLKSLSISTISEEQQLQNHETKK